MCCLLIAPLPVYFTYKLFLQHFAFLQHPLAHGYLDIGLSMLERMRCGFVWPGVR